MKMFDAPNEGGSFMIASSVYTVDTLQLTDQYLSHIALSAAATTVSNRRYMLTPLFRGMVIKDVTQITYYDLDIAMAQWCRGKKPSSVDTLKGCLRSFFQYCQEAREINMLFPWDAIKRKKQRPARVQTFTAQEVQAVIAKTQRRQDRLMIALLFQTGMRIGELIALRLEHIHGEQIQLHGKGQVNRVVYMSPELAQDIRLYCAQRMFTVGHVFRPLQAHKSHPSTRYISAYAVRDRIEAAFKRCGYDMHPHQLRHSFAVHWLRSGGDLRTLQIILGHDNIETTQAYLHLTDDMTHEIYSRVMGKMDLGH